MKTVFRFILAGGIAALAAYVWLKANDVVVSIYVTLASIYFLSSSLRFPTTGWWQGRRLAEVNSSWGRKKVGVDLGRQSQIARLGEILSVRNYMTSLTYLENTNRMCLQFHESVTLRGAMSLAGALLVYYADRNGLVPPTDPLLWIIRLLGLTFPVVMQLTWDYSRFVQQTTLNLGVARPPR